MNDLAAELLAAIEAINRHTGIVVTPTMLSRWARMAEEMATAPASEEEPTSERTEK